MRIPSPFYVSTNPVRFAVWHVSFHFRHRENRPPKPDSPSAEIRVENITIGRDEYKNAYITKRNPAEATIYHSTGVATYPIEQLSPELQKQLGFDPNAAQTYRSAVAEAQKEARDRADATRVTEQPYSSVTTAYRPSTTNALGSDRVYFRDYQTYVGPRGGVYHYSASANRVYERR